VTNPKLAQLEGQNYISLETFKKSGEGVKTPVWFVLQDGVLYVYTEADSWKIKRIRNNPRVRVAICNMRGDVKGPWLDATASIIAGDEQIAVDKLLSRKYLMKRIFGVFSKLRGRGRTYVKIVPAG
jgi:PPOX class probable F420-dependent enzyme